MCGIFAECSRLLELTTFSVCCFCCSAVVNLLKLFVALCMLCMLIHGSLTPVQFADILKFFTASENRAYFRAALTFNCTESFLPSCFMLLFYFADVSDIYCVIILSAVMQLFYEQMMLMIRSFILSVCFFVCQQLMFRDATTAEKLRGTKVWVPTPGRLRPESAPRPAKGRAGCWVREGSPALPLVRVRGITPWKFWKTPMLNPAFCCEISCFLKTTAKKLGGTNTLLVPNLKVGGTSLPQSLRLLRLC